MRSLNYELLYMNYMYMSNISYIQLMNLLPLICLYKIFPMENIRSLKLHVKLLHSVQKKKKNEKQSN